MNTLSTRPDHELVQMYETGNDEAFDILLNRYKDYVYSYILFLVQDQSRADDFFQDTFTRVIVSIRNHKYHPFGKFSAWVIRIAHNLIMDQSRYNDNSNTLTMDEFPRSIVNSIQLAQDSHEASIIKNQGTSALEDLLNYLPENQRQVVILRFYENRSFKEIAAITGVSINTSLGRMRYALLNLRHMIQRQRMSLVG